MGGSVLIATQEGRYLARATIRYLPHSLLVLAMSLELSTRTLPASHLRLGLHLAVLIALEIDRKLATVTVIHCI